MRASTVPAQRAPEPGGEVPEQRMGAVVDDDLPGALAAGLRDHWKAPDGVGDPDRPIAHVHRAPSPEAPAPTGPVRTTEFDGEQLACFAAGDALCLRGADGGYCRFELATATEPAHLWVGGPRPNRPLYLAMSEVLRERGWLSVHASGVVAAGRDEGATLFLGESGAGKSFRLLAELERGARALADDRVWLRAQDLLVAPRDVSMRVLPDAFDRYAALAGTAPTRDPDGKFRITFAALGVKTTRPTPLREVVLLRRRHRVGGRPDALGRLDHVRLLWDGMGIPITEAARRYQAGAIARMMTMVRVD